jgi:hypothetical protein
MFVVSVAGAPAFSLAGELPWPCRCHLGTAPHPIHQSFWGYSVARKDLLVALKVDRVGQLAQKFLDELVGVPGTPQDPRGFLVRPDCRRGAHTPSIRSSSPGVRGNST